MKGQLYQFPAGHPARRATIEPIELPGDTLVARAIKLVGAGHVPSGAEVGRWHDPQTGLLIIALDMGLTGVAVIIDPRQKAPLVLDTHALTNLSRSMQKILRAIRDRRKP